MRYLSIHLMSVLSIAVLLSCGQPEEPDLAIVDVDFVAHDFIDCCTIHCGELFVVSFKDESPAGWYWTSLERNGEIVYTGVGRYIETPDVFHRCTLSYHYWGGLSQGQYDLQLYRCDYPSQVGKPEWSKSRGGPIDITLFSFVEGVCELDCCTYGGYSDGYYYAQMYRDVGGPGIVGVSASIRTRYGLLCGEMSSTCEPGVAHSVAYVDLARYPPSGGKAWAQMGFYRRRWDNDGVMVIDSGRYWEIDDGTLFQRRLDSTDRVPVEGELHAYRVEKGFWDVESWDFYFDDTLWMAHPAPPGWVGQTGERAHWSGEVLGHESDMPGRNNYRCYFAQCAYDSGYGYKSAHFFEPNVPVENVNDQDEWELQKIDDESFYLWDKNPLSGF